MEKAADSQQKASIEIEDNLSDEMKKLISTLPRDYNLDGSPLYQYKGVWHRAIFLAGIIPSQRHFQAQDSDIIVATFPKSGTTWLKALTYAIVHRHKCSFKQSPILTTNPHELVPFLEVEYFINKKNTPSFEHLPTPRILGTHMPYSCLPHSIVNSKCRIVYMSRNPLDQFVSMWHFLSKIAHDEKRKPISLEEAFERVCLGIQGFGPFWEHILGYWKTSLNNPKKILFLKYEDVRDDTLFYVKKLANFLGCPFSDDEENQGVIKEVVKLCSLESMKNLEVNKIKTSSHGPHNSHYFRKGEVGDWTNYLSPSMSERLNSLIEEKFSGSGLTFRMS